MFSTGFGDLEA